jgi:hypothetical protein
MHYNANPWGLDEEDCVTRAISAALNIKYVAVGNLLEVIAEANGCDKLCVCCYNKLLEEIFGLKPEYCYGETVGAVAEANPGRKLLIRIDGHLTCSMYGVVIDTWDCTDKIADCYWIVE